MAEKAEVSAEQQAQYDLPSPESAHSGTLQSPNSCSRWNINLKLLPIKVYYFIFMAGVGDLLPFIAIYMQQLGLTPQETGTIYGVMPFVGFFARPVIGALSDKYKKHKLVLVIVTTLSGVFYFLLVFVPARQLPQNQVVHTLFACNTKNSYFQDCSNRSEPTSCSVGLTHFANSTKFSNSSSLTCTVSCWTNSDSEMKEFHACFTNQTESYSSSKCNSTNYTKQMKFMIPDLEKVFASEMSRNREQSDSWNCQEYEVKGIHFSHDSSHEAERVICDRELVLDCSIECPHAAKCEQSSASRLDITFFMFFFVFLMANVAFAPVFPILDAAAYENLGADHHLWGKQRMWGTFGFALFAVTSTFIMTMQKEDEQEVNYAISFYMFLPLCVKAAVAANFITMSTDIRCGQFVKNIWQLLSYAEVSAFLFVVMYFGMLLGGLETFLFWFLQMIGSTPLVFGFILLINCCAEVPLLWFAGVVIKKIGLVMCLYLTLICYSIRMLFYSFLEEPWLVLLVEPLYGVCFAIMYAAASSYASLIAPPGMSATMQGVLGGLHFGFGKGLGSLVTGFMFEGLGPRWTWRVYAISSFALLVIYAGLNTLVFRPHHRPPSVRPPVTNGNPDEQATQQETLINSDKHTAQPEI